MSSWLLVLIVTAQSAGTWYGGVDTDVTLHDFPSRELCESAAKRVKKEVDPTFKTHVSYSCMERRAGEWREQEEK